MCLYPPTGRVFINMHVIFDENTFLYKVTPSPRGFSLTSLIQAWQKGQSATVTCDHTIPTTQNSQELEDMNSTGVINLPFPLTDNSLVLQPPALQIVSSTATGSIENCEN